MDKYLEAMKTAKEVYLKLVASENSQADEWFYTFVSGITEVAINDESITTAEFEKLIEIKYKYI